jgi:hypothetical protein
MTSQRVPSGRNTRRTSRNTAIKVLDIEPIVRLEAKRAAPRAAALAERALRCLDPSRGVNYRPCVARGVAISGQMPGE